MFRSTPGRILVTQLALVIPVAVLLSSGFGLVLLQVRGERLLSVQSASMVPSFRPGDAIIVKPGAHSLQPGTIISYRSLRDPRVIISHRLLSIDKTAGRLTTAGDAVQTADPPLAASQVVGQVTAVAPRLGLVLDLLHRPLGLILLVYLPALVVMFTEIKRLLAHYTYPHYRLASYR